MYRTGSTNTILVLHIIDIICDRAFLRHKLFSLVCMERLFIHSFQSDMTRGQYIYQTTQYQDFQNITNGFLMRQEEAITKCHYWAKTCEFITQLSLGLYHWTAFAKIIYGNALHFT